MRNTVIWSFLSLVALASGGLITGCDSDDAVAKSAAGESCDKTSDCADGLKCLQGTCYQQSSSGGSANEGGDGSGGTVVGPVPPVLGGEGETCTKRADCEDGLSCISSRCTKDDGGGEGGTGNTSTLGRKGETCGLTSDCQKGLACLPTDGNNGFPIPLAIGSNSVGVCTPTDNGLEATGNVCGAECTKNEDCCELPIVVHVPWAAIETPGVSGPNGTGANSCTELAALLDGVNCATTKVAMEQAQCFAQTAYCECGKNTWTCSDAGRCEYTAACTAGTVGAIPGGCPAYTRTSVTTPTTTCAKTKKCVTTSEPTCEKDADCDATVAVSGSATPDTCANGKCICNTEDNLCYRPCGEDLDCPVHYACNTDTSLCEPAAACESDAFCVTSRNDVNSKCVEGECTSQCQNDLDCNGGLLTNGGSTRICNAAHQCELVGCTGDSECQAVGGVRTFCTKAPEIGTTGEYVSAVTD